MPLPKPGPAPRIPTVEETSAGGMVVDFDARGYPVAVIGRLNRGGRLEWCLPKGHLEAGETEEQAAIREIHEETGILGDIVGRLGDVEYWFAAGGQRIHKMVHHYLLRARGGTITVENDPDHEAVEAAWVPIVELPARLSFPNERRIARLAYAAIAGQA
ncbi:NUDIX hydrolase [Spelaeicoccus albus]|uniref:8-oxo-dGTP pyrophosphatase MutT (NUDIX family) n=1 Tax=Spelaeicoccus albus TaxID=1280376 RepID=A0A7Z0AB33_9MICO|nr:NUDIX hydrolase [Spelaeicoccus albus]NYI66575.1 8-oxo-dGTP pyrophosphatase MutT (NUDIX family) [Spelaeicoccus albus]